MQLPANPQRFDVAIPRLEGHRVMVPTIAAMISIVLAGMLAAYLITSLVGLD